MQRDDVEKLARELPAGEWRVVEGQSPEKRSIVSDTGAVIAAELTPEAAALLLHARTLLPKLMAELEDERAYLQHKTFECRRLHLSNLELSSRLLELETAVYSQSQSPLAALPPASPTWTHPKNFRLKVFQVTGPTKH
ncbi:hypothetical protein F6X40_11125 [Paraburkholderia sp. UCT31]|uniref:hypothetical protein n=1 Tax=Paraburkholderia sp. UCT31 TaxID=2615209 RepID=UPI0016562DE7|nr:hypothetical protein [Paraburkholderia sp. UCT31]MBC8737355.1 hypothetical protein [Paraburkholderia sp. UCT31]